MTMNMTEHTNKNLIRAHGGLLAEGFLQRQEVLEANAAVTIALWVSSSHLLWLMLQVHIG